MARSPRLTRKTGGIVLFVVLMVGLSSWAFESSRVSSELSKARDDLRAGRLVDAYDCLSWLRGRSRRHEGEVLYRLGGCERDLGRPRAALDVWGHVPSKAPEFAQSALERGRLAVEIGEYRLAEECLRASLRRAGEHQTAALVELRSLLRIEGRLDEVRRLLHAAWDEMEGARLVELWKLEREPTPVRGLRSVLEKAHASAPEDDRVWLGLAWVDLQTGNLRSAGEWLDRCEARAPADPVVQRARLNWARTANDPDAVLQALARLPEDELTASEIAEIEVWLARRLGDETSEREALDRLLELTPGAILALERRVELAARHGEDELVATLRDRKAELDRAIDRYNERIDDRDPDRFRDLSEAAGVLGRTFEARAWALLAVRSRPESAESRFQLDALPPHPLPRPRISPRQLAQSYDGRLHGTRVSASTRSGPTFVDETDSSGLRFRFENGQSPLRQLPETMSGGLGLLDYDGDGWLDVYVVQGGPFPPAAPGVLGDRLWRNRGDGTFEDATESAGLAQLPGGYGHGVAAGDLDSDGDPDLFITRWRRYALYRNEGDGTFTDITEMAGLGGDRDWPTSAAFADFDGDRDLDLYVCHYVEWDERNPRICRRSDTNEAQYCSPRLLPARRDHLFRNDDGRFVDVSEPAGIHDTDGEGRGLGVLAADLDGDRDTDIYVANDMTANFLFENQGDWNFVENAHAAGLAGNAEGGYQAGMGVACGDIDGDGLVDLAVTNFEGEGTTLYHNLGGGLFADRSEESGLLLATRSRLGFGVAFVDGDQDGLLDLVQANGHVNDFSPLFDHAIPAQYLRGDSNARFKDLRHDAGSPWTVPRVGRGLVVGDLDNDLRPDVLILEQNGPVAILSNRTEVAGSSVVLQLEGASSNRDAIGALVTVQAGNRTWALTRFSGGSYQSSGDHRLHIGLGEERLVETIQVDWPSGQTDRFHHLETNAAYRIREGDSAVTPLPGYRAIRGE